MIENQRRGFWIRVLAAVIDLSILLPLIVAAEWVAFVFSSGATRAAGDGDRDIPMALVYVTYSLTEIFFSASPGKMILGLRIGASNGIDADRWRLFSRWSTKHSGMICFLLFSISGFGFLHFLSGCLNCIMGLGCFFAANDDKQAWHDQWCGTAVFGKVTARRAGFPVMAQDPSRSTAQDDTTRDREVGA
jgi:uncharacterized RDD family membrane protein YckC